MKSYRSRIDALLLTVVLVILLFVDVAAIGVLAPALGQPFPWLPLLFYCVAATVPVLLAATLIPIRYRFIHRGLEVRSGLALRWHIPIANIHRALPVVSLRPAPALSSKRLRIDYQDGERLRSIQISPATPELFLHDLHSLDEGLDLVDGSVIRHRGPILLFDSLAS